MMTLLVVDDHPVVRDALRSLLDSDDDIVVIGTAADGHEAVALVLELSPDVVLMDLEMPRGDGIEAIRRLGDADSASRIVVLTTFSDRERILGALDAGAVGYLLKDAEPEEIIRGVRAAARGETPLAPRAARVGEAIQAKHGNHGLASALVEVQRLGPPARRLQRLTSHRWR